MNQDKQTEQPLGLIILSGAGLGEWAWRSVVEALRVPYIHISYPRSNPKAGMREYVASALEQTHNLPAQKIIVIGHSIGGTIGLDVAEALGEKLVGFIAIAAAIPEKGGSFVSSLPFPQKILMPLIIRLAGTKPPAVSLKKSYCNDLNDAQTEEVLHRFVAETKQVYLDKSSLPPQVPKLYIKTTKDTDFPAPLQDKMAKNLGADNIVSIESGHLPMLAKPAELASHLNSFCDAIT